MILYYLENNSLKIYKRVGIQKKIIDLLNNGGMNLKWKEYIIS